MNVIDIGCFDHPRHLGERQDSIGRLIRRFHPDRLIGFDPQSGPWRPSTYRIHGTEVILSRFAVWTGLGVAQWHRSGAPLGSHIAHDGDSLVETLDIAAIARRWSNPSGLVVKIDAEGGEYPLLERLHETGTDTCVSLLLVEWHGEPRPDLVDCPVEVWE